MGLAAKSSPDAIAFRCPSFTGSSVRAADLSIVPRGLTGLFIGKGSAGEGFAGMKAAELMVLALLSKAVKTCSDFWSATKQCLGAAESLGPQVPGGMAIFLLVWGTVERSVTAGPDLHPPFAV